MSFGQPGSCIAVHPKRGAGVRDEFWAAILNQIAGFGDDVFQKFENVPEAGLAIDDFGDGLMQGRIEFDFTGGAQRACRGFVPRAWCHLIMLRPREAKGKGQYRPDSCFAGDPGAIRKLVNAGDKPGAILSRSRRMARPG